MGTSYDDIVSINEVSTFEWFKFEIYSSRSSVARTKAIFGVNTRTELAIRNQMRLIIVQYNVAMELQSIYPAEEIGLFGSKSCGLLPELERRVEHDDKHCRIQ